jgi:voltage-gated potassium channel
MINYHKTRHQVHKILHPELGNTYWDRAFNVFIILLIVLNVMAVMLETVPHIYEPNKLLFHRFDVFSVWIFTIEYILRVWSCVHEKKYSHPVYGRLRYIFSAGAMIDLLAISPFYLHVFIGLDLRMIRILRLFRFLRLFRLTAYMKATKLIINVFRSNFNILLLSLVLTLFLIIISSSLVYFAEHLAQPDVFTSIPQTIWWSIITLTTVGYGDMVPITIAGKVFTSIILIAGVALLALPAGIITAGFLEETRKQNRGKHVCPHCHMPLDNAGDNEHLHL